MKQPPSADSTTVPSTSYACSSHIRKQIHNYDQNNGRNAIDVASSQQHQYENSYGDGQANDRPPPLCTVYSGYDSRHNLDTDSYSHDLLPPTIVGLQSSSSAGCTSCVESAARYCPCAADASPLSSAALPPFDESAAATIVVPHSQQSTVSTGGVRFANGRDYFSAFQQQQQFAFFPNASEKVMASTWRIIVLSIYVSSLVLAIMLFLLAAVYCQVTSCSIVWTEKNRQYAQLFPICGSCLIAFLSTCWLIANLRHVKTSCMRDYSFLEMPSSVFSALLAGVCAVIEIHYNFDYSYLYWSEKWALAAADAVILVFLHAGLAFALT